LKVIEKNSEKVYFTSASGSGDHCKRDIRPAWQLVASFTILLF